MIDETLITPLESAVAAESTPGEVDAMDEGIRPVVIYTTGSPQDGEIVRGILESEGIPAILTNAASSALGEIFNLGEGQAGEILVAPADVERAKSLIAATTFTDADEK